MKAINYLLGGLIVLSSCKTDTLKSTKWRVISLKPDSINTLKQYEIQSISNFDTSIHLYQSFQEKIVITQIENGEHPDTSEYKYDGKKIIYSSPGHDTYIDVILRVNHDTMFCRSNEGILATLLKQKN